MPNYDFRPLNDKEFETLVADLLSAEHGVTVERFKPGKDAGVDGRWFTQKGRETIIQCKHWVGTGFAGLLARLKNVEFAKVNALKPARYILATSVPLSRKNKQDIAEALGKHLKSESDILGQEDLNDLLAKHQGVEARHPKLWLSSAGTLITLLNRAVVGRSAAVLVDMHARSELFVSTSDFDRVLKHLAARHVLVLTGEPGIGKTTLASQAVLKLVADGFDLVSIEGDIAEAEAAYSDATRQVFYFDDFLGRTYLASLRAKQDSHLVGFMTRIERDPSKRFILTSRTNIVNQGLDLSDLLPDLATVENTYEVSIAALKKIDRAKILYNHIWHSSLPPDFIDELYADARYKAIIAHQNFNPRLIAFLVDASKLAGMKPDAYWPYIAATLENPAAVWSHFFEKQLSQADRDVAHLVVLNGGKIEESALRDAFAALPGNRTGNAVLTYREFSRAVMHAAGSVLVRNLDEKTGHVVYSLFNPSIADYVQHYLKDAQLWDYYFPQLRSLEALTELEDLREAEFIDSTAFAKTLVGIATIEQARPPNKDRFRLRLALSLSQHQDPGRQASGLILEWLQEPDTLTVALESDWFVELVLNSNACVDAAEWSKGLRQLADLFIEGRASTLDPNLVSRLLGALELEKLADLRDEIRSKVVDEWEEHYADKFTKEQDLLGDFMDPEEYDRAERKLERSLRKELLASGIELSADELQRIAGAVDIADVITENATSADRDDYEMEYEGSGGSVAISEDAAIDDLFERER